MARVTASQEVRLKPPRLRPGREVGDIRTAGLCQSERLHAGLKTGIIRSMGGTGGVVTTAGLVFAFTMGSMVASDLRVAGQIGTTIMLGLLFDTLVVRSFMTPSIAGPVGLSAEQVAVPLDVLPHGLRGVAGDLLNGVR
jgi:hypothetical protein